MQAPTLHSRTFLRSVGSRPAPHTTRPRPGTAVQRVTVQGVSSVERAAPSTQPEQEQQVQQPADSTYHVSEYVRPQKRTYAPPSIKDTGTLRPPAEWYPAWMRYRRREDNHVFWQDKFRRNSLDISYEERRWTVFSTFWFIVMQARFYMFPPALRYIVYLGWRVVMHGLYQAHKAFILWQCKLDAALAARGAAQWQVQKAAAAAAKSWQAAAPQAQAGVAGASSTPVPTDTSSSSSSQGADIGELSEQPSVVAADHPEGAAQHAAATGEAQAAKPSSGVPADPPGIAGTAASQVGPGVQVGAALQQQQQRPVALGPGFSRTMAFRRLHWQNSLVAELLYYVNIIKTGRVHMLPPKKGIPQRPTCFWLF